MSFRDFNLLVNYCFPFEVFEKEYFNKPTFTDKISKRHQPLCQDYHDSNYTLPPLSLSFSLSLSLSLNRSVCVSVYYFNSIDTSNDELINQEHPHIIPGPISKRRCPGYRHTKPSSGRRVIR